MSSMSVKESAKHIFDAFPLPKAFKVPAVGIDVSDTTIKYVHFKENKEGFFLHQYGDKKIPPGVVESGEIKDTTKLAKALRELKKEFDIKSVHASLPEERAYLFETEVVLQKGQHIRDTLEFHLEENVPTSSDQAVFDFDVIGKKEGEAVVSVSVMPRDVVGSYEEAFEKAGIFLEALEIEAQAIARSCVPKDDNGSFLIVDMGRTRTGVALVSSHIVRFTSTVEIGGDHFTQIIQEVTPEPDFENSKKLKETKGLYQENEEVSAKLLSLCSELAQNLKKHINFWEGRSFGKKENKISGIILCGGNATVPGIKEELGRAIGVKTVIADVWQNVFDAEKEVPPILYGDSLSFATAIGLAIKR